MQRARRALRLALCGGALVALGLGATGDLRLFVGHVAPTSPAATTGEHVAARLDALLLSMRTDTRNERGAGPPPRRPSDDAEARGLTAGHIVSTRRRPDAPPADLPAIRTMNRDASILWPVLDAAGALPGHLTAHITGRDPLGGRSLVLWRRQSLRADPLARTRSTRDGDFDFGHVPVPNAGFDLVVTTVDGDPLAPTPVRVAPIRGPTSRAPGAVPRRARR